MINSNLQSISKKFLDLSNLPSNIKNCQYAVRGQIPLRAQEITKELQNGKKYPFKKVTFCNVCVGLIIFNLFFY